MTMPKCMRLAMIEKRVVSLPPCWVALEVKAAANLSDAGRRSSTTAPACSQKLPIAEGMRPNRVGAPTMIAS